MNPLLCSGARSVFFFFFSFYVSTGKTLHSKFCCAHQFINERTSAGGFYLRRGGSSGTRVQFESLPYLHRTLPARRPASHRASGKCAEQFLSQFSRPPHAENEQGADKMQKCTVGRVACGCSCDGDTGEIL